MTDRFLLIDDLATGMRLELDSDGSVWVVRWTDAAGRVCAAPDDGVGAPARWFGLAEFSRREARLGERLILIADGSLWIVTSVAPLDCPAGGMVFALPADSTDPDAWTGFEGSEFAGLRVSS